MTDIKQLAVGQELPELHKDADLVQFVAYAGATWDFHRYHYDTEYTKSLGLPGPIADGQMFGAYLAQMLMDWAGSNAFIRKMSVRYKSLVPAGERVTCWGRITDIDTQERLVTLDIGVRGEDGRDVVGSASAVVEL